MNFGKFLKNTILACGVLPIAANAETLVFASTNPEPVPINRFLEQWVAEVNEAAGGVLDIDIRHGPTLANHTNYYDRVIDGVVDISWGLSVFNPGKFTNSLIMTMPFYLSSAEQSAVISCRMYEAGAFGSDYEDLKPLLFAAFPNASLHTIDTPIEGLGSMDGLNVIATSPPSIEITKGNNGTPLSVVVSESYEALQRGTADAIIVPATALPAFRLDELVKHHYFAPLGGAGGAVFMSRENYDALPEAARAIIDEYSTCEKSREFGIFIDEWEAEVRASLEASEDHTVSAMSPEEVQGVINYVGEEVLESFETNMPGGKPLVDELLRQIEAFE